MTGQHIHLKDEKNRVVVLTMGHNQDSGAIEPEPEFATSSLTPVYRTKRSRFYTLQ
jgi:hypothetical protein